MPDCWASSLGDCASDQSKEHILSRALWPGPAIDVVGFPWCRDKPKRIGLGSLVAKILCTTHNSLLSPADTAAKNAIDVFRETTQLTNSRRKVQPGRWVIQSYVIDGPLLERWFLKTTINLCAISGQDQKWWIDPGRPIQDPPPQLVKAAFGLEPLPKPMGLYAAANRGENLDLADEVHASTLLVPGNLLAGALFKFRGYRFFMYLGDTPPTTNITIPNAKDPASEFTGILYHLKRINWTVAGHLSHEIDFTWP